MFGKELLYGTRGCREAYKGLPHQEWIGYLLSVPSRKNYAHSTPLQITQNLEQISVLHPFFGVNCVFCKIFVDLILRKYLQNFFRPLLGLQRTLTPQILGRFGHMREKD